MIVRRASELFSLAMTPASIPNKIANSPALVKSRIVTGAAIADKYWLFLTSANGLPFAIEAKSGMVCRFEIPGLAVPGSQVPEIQGCVIVPHVKAAIVMLAGGDRATWPRPGNGPVYFWIDLTSGTVVQFQMGWQLNSFSGDERIAYFADVRGEGRHTNLAIDMTTGKQFNSNSAYRPEGNIPFDWFDKQKVKPLGGSGGFSGLSIDGRAVPVNTGVMGIHYLSMAKAGDGFAGFRLRRNGANDSQPSPLWIVPLNEPQKTEPIANGVTDFSLLDQGNVAFVTLEHKDEHEVPPHRRHYETHFYSRAGKTTWNVFDGIERLPRLDQRLAQADYIEDRQSVRLIEGFGTNRHSPFVVCFFSHHRNDLRANPMPVNGVTLKPENWRCAIAVEHDGKRSLVPLFREGNMPEKIWLHKSGKLITGNYDFASQAWHLSHCKLTRP